MVEVTASMVRDLREKTGAGMMDCKKALAESGGDFEKAVDFLRQKGLATAAKRAGRVDSEGRIGSYIHTGGKIGVMVEVNSETDFVAKTDEFQTFARDVAMHIAAANPPYVRREEVPEAVLEREKEIYRVQAREAKKPEKIMDKIVQGKLEKYYTEVCLLEQPFVRDPDVTIQDLLNSLIGKLGEKIEIRRFVRFQVGEGMAKD
ncbi:MAG TPA: translation elongation factor Ts [Thermodesulfobacteriota bacterium]|nr:translation elongation factor Ts [Thermodesulfobacteriota bacterium]